MTTRIYFQNFVKQGQPAQTKKEQAFMFMKVLKTEWDMLHKRVLTE